MAAFQPRQCARCRSSIEPEAVRAWTINSFIPAGKTVRYVCQCGNDFQLRTLWHRVLLLAGIVLTIWVLPELMHRGGWTMYFAFAVLAYMVVVVIIDSFDRWKNPVWR
jgi:hypothetical protein